MFTELAHTAPSLVMYGLYCTVQCELYCAYSANTKTQPFTVLTDEWSR
jgi:hypothetical protein